MAPTTGCASPAPTGPPRSRLLSEHRETRAQSPYSPLPPSPHSSHNHPQTKGGLSCPICLGPPGPDRISPEQGNQGMAVQPPGTRDLGHGQISTWLRVGALFVWLIWINGLQH